MRIISRRGFSSGILALIAAACGGKVGGDEPSNDVPIDDPPSPPGVPGIDAGAAPSDPGLAFDPVTNNAPPPRVVWTWTTPEQAAEVRSGKVLFTVESSPTMGRGFLFDVLQQRADAGDAAASRLVGPELLKGRFGWSNPWATVRGAIDGESYGLELIAITMKPDTLYARVTASGGDITFVDATGKDVPTEAALAAYDRVGGILFHNDIDSNRLCGTSGAIGSGTGGGAMIYREIYLGNEAQIASFSHRTQDILDAITKSQADLVALRGALGPQKTPLQWECLAAKLWASGGAGSSVERYLASLAFATELYTPTDENLAAIVAELQKARFTPDPFVSP